MKTTRRRSCWLAACVSVAAAAAASLATAPAATASSGPLPGWRRVYAAPASYCMTALGQYASKGYLTTACHYYGSPSTGGTGGWFDIHRG